MQNDGDAVREKLREGGCWFFRQGKGDYEIWCSAHARRPFVVDGKVTSRHTANEIMKQAGLTHRFR